MMVKSDIRNSSVENRFVNDCFTEVIGNDAGHAQ